MNFLQKIIWWFSPYYVDVFEKELDVFLQSLGSHSAAPFVQQRLLYFMQQDLIKVAIYFELKFKGYTQLKKSERRKLYKNADLIRRDFAEFCQQKNIDTNNKLKIVSALTEYLSPQNKFCYLDSSAFFGLLKNPHTEKLVGDCNQICTLYVALSSAYLSATDWNIHLYNEHVSLVFEDQEIEATNGTVGVIKKGGMILPIEHLVTVNILDISEANRKKFAIVPSSFLQASRLVKIISPNNKIAQQNLTASLKNMGLDLLQKNRFELAERCFLQLQDNALLQNLYLRAVKQLIEDKKFSIAEKWAKKSSSKKLKIFVYHTRAKQALKKKKYKLARKYFEKSGEIKNMLVVDETEMFAWYESVKELEKISDLKKKKTLIKKIYDRSKQVNHKDMKSWCESVFKEI